jgi:hypothetical protein
LLFASRLNKASVSYFRLPRKAYCLTRSCSVCADPAEISTGRATRDFAAASRVTV